MEIPELNKIADEYKDSTNIVFLAIGLDPREAVEEFIQRLPFSYNVVSDGQSISSLYRVTGYPTNAVIDKSGNVLFHTSGYGRATVPWIRKSILKALQ
jgi:peroxiredoxin